MNHHDDYAEHNSEFKGEIQRDQNQFHYFHFFNGASPLEKKISRLQLSFNFVAWLTKQHKLNEDHTMETQSEDAAFSCVQCNLSFKMTKDLKTHMLQHEGKKFHSCSQCKYSTIGASHLKCHMRVHSGEKPFACKQCNFACTQASKSHMLTHSGEKSFICTQCDYSCTTTGILKRHMLTHLDEKPFQLYSVWLLFHNGWYT